MAGSILVRELDLDIYRIDLATVVSKCIGETEENLSKLFDEAETPQGARSRPTLSSLL